jgi:hypothetical protein
MLTTEAKEILQTIERRMKPARAPWHADQTVLDDWSRLLTRYERDQVSNAFKNHLDDGKYTWPTYYAFEQLLKRERPPRVHTDSTCHCFGSGWIYAKPFTAHGHQYDRVIPCSCHAGKIVAGSDTWLKARDLSANGTLE